MFDPVQIIKALCGGLLIGAGAATLLLFNGRVAGISGILSQTLRGAAGPSGWRVAFLVGLVAPAALLGLGGVRLDAGLPLLGVAGLLVGIGAGVGSGCTSGHGVCGISRLSPRSLVATAVFMATAMLTVFVVRYGLS
jgi:uncharacterized membrane protein YedE/YeeE